MFCTCMMSFTVELEMFHTYLKYSLKRNDFFFRFCNNFWLIYFSFIHIPVVLLTTIQIQNLTVTKSNPSFLLSPIHIFVWGIFGKLQTFWLNQTNINLSSSGKRYGIVHANIILK